jgi:hypothetical protein
MPPHFWRAISRLADRTTVFAMIEMLFIYQLDLSARTQPDTGGDAGGACSACRGDGVDARDARIRDALTFSQAAREEPDDIREVLSHAPPHLETSR